MIFVYKLNFSAHTILYHHREEEYISRPRFGRQTSRQADRPIDSSLDVLDDEDDLEAGLCETTGYELRIRQNCETIVESVCMNVTVTKYNKKIERNCTTRVS